MNLAFAGCLDSKVLLIGQVSTPRLFQCIDLIMYFVDFVSVHIGHSLRLEYSMLIVVLP